jgi:hypothetical protein
MSYPNLDLLESAAAKLRPLLREIVFALSAKLDALSRIG